MPSRLTLGCLLVGLMGGTLAQGAVQPVSWLLEQVRIGEARGREDLVSNSLYSLSLVEPNHPELLAAQARQACVRARPGRPGSCSPGSASRIPTLRSIARAWPISP